MTTEELDKLRAEFIQHALARRVLAVETERAGVRTIAVGRVIGVTPVHFVLLAGERSRDVVLPLDAVAKVHVLEGDSKAVAR